MDNSAEFESANFFRGTHEIVTSTVSGAFGTVGSITGSISGGFSL